jgi:flavin-dependent dehydrogenase
VTVDVAIVGAGPVGLAAAIEARLAGLSVVLIEQRDGTIDKACGEGLMPGALPMLARLGIDPAGHPLRGVTYHQGHREVTHRFRGSAGRGVRRLVLHTALSDRAAELGISRVTAKVVQVEQSATSVSVAGVTARYLLACDGLHSTVAHLVGLTEAPALARGSSRPRSRHKRYGVRQHFAVAPWSDLIEVYYGRDAELYVTPVSDTEVGVAMLAGQGTSFDDAIAAEPFVAKKLAGAEPVSTRRGAGPFRQRTRARTAGRVLLVGDASGYVDAITGEGLRLGFAQAQVAVACIAADQPADYEKAWRVATRDFRILTTGLVTLATSAFRFAIVPLAARFPKLFGLIVERLAR